MLTWLKEDFLENNTSFLIQLAMVLAGVTFVLLAFACGRFCCCKPRPKTIKGWETRTGKLKTLLCITSSLFRFKVKKVASYSRRRKFSLSFSMLWIAIFFSKKFTEMLTGNAYGINLSNICTNSTSKLDQIEIDVKTYVNLEESREQYRVAVYVRELAWSVGDSYVYPGLTESWPDACDEDKAEDALYASKYRMCSEPKTICADAGFWDTFIVDDHQCVTVDIPYECPGPYATSDEDTLADYNRYEAQKSGTVELFFDSKTWEDEVAQMLDLLLQQIDMACNLYIGYLVAMIWLAPPVLLYKSKFASRLKRGWCKLNQVQFVIFVVLLWNSYTYFVIPLKAFDVGLYMRNFLDDPCYIEPGFNTDKADIISDVCLEVNMIEMNFTKVAYSFTDLHYYAKLYDICFEQLCAATCRDDCIGGCTEPFWSEGQDILDATFVGNCNASVKGELLERYASPNSDATTNGWAVFATSGLLAQMVIKIVITNMVLRWHMFGWPWIFHNGNVEVTHIEQELDINDITWYLRWQNFLPAIFWTASTAICLTSLLATMRWDDIRLADMTMEEVAIAVLVTIPMFFVVCYECVPKKKKKRRRTEGIELVRIK